MSDTDLPGSTHNDDELPNEDDDVGDPMLETSELPLFNFANCRKVR